MLNRITASAVVAVFICLSNAPGDDKTDLTDIASVIKEAGGTLEWRNSESERQISGIAFKGIKDYDDESLRKLDLRKRIATIDGPISLNLRGTQITDAGLQELRDLKNLTFLDLRSTKITDEGLRHLSQIENLQVLFLGETSITDEGLKELNSLQHISHLDLSRTQITDVGIKELQNHKALEALFILHTTVTYKGLEEIARIKSLKRLDCRFTQTTDAGLKKLQKSLPKLKVISQHDVKGISHR
jgi:hypothetical protein